MRRRLAGRFEVIVALCALDVMILANLMKSVSHALGAGA